MTSLEQLSFAELLERYAAELERNAKRYETKSTHRNYVASGLEAAATYRARASAIRSQLC
jgi:hypothetical protein